MKNGIADEAKDFALSQNRETLKITLGQKGTKSSSKIDIKNDDLQKIK